MSCPSLLNFNPGNLKLVRTIPREHTEMNGTPGRLMYMNYSIDNLHLYSFFI